MDSKKRLLFAIMFIAYLNSLFQFFIPDLHACLRDFVFLMEKSRIKNAGPECLNAFTHLKRIDPRLLENTFLLSLGT